VVMRDGATLGSPRGQMLRFAETLVPIAA
jgi:hypothetical protein